MNSSRPPNTIEIDFEYRASTEVDPELAFSACAVAVGTTHIHPGWREFKLVRMYAHGGDQWRVLLTDVPYGPNRIRVSDPNECRNNSTGAVTTPTVFANGVLLTNMVDTPGDGIEPGFSFQAIHDGSVIP